MQRVRGIGGIFFKARDPEALGRWYAEHLGVDVQGWGGAIFKWKDADPTGTAYTVWTPFKADTTYFEPGTSSFMINFRVDDLAAMLDQLRAAGATVDDKVEESEFGRFGWVVDPEGNKLELWQPG